MRVVLLGDRGWSMDGEEEMRRKPRKSQQRVQVEAVQTVTIPLSEAIRVVEAAGYVVTKKPDPAKHPAVEAIA